MATAAFITGCETTSQTPAELASVQPEQVYKVYGMDCPGCHGGLEKNLEKIAGVTDAVANWKEQTVKLYLDDAAAVTRQQINQAVEDSNFTLGEQVL